MLVHYSTQVFQNGKIANLPEVMLEPMDRILIECRADCACRGECNNKLTSEQIPLRTEIDYFPGKGFGVRIKDFAAKG